MSPLCQKMEGLITILFISIVQVILSYISSMKIFWWEVKNDTKGFKLHAHSYRSTPNVCYSPNIPVSNILIFLPPSSWKTNKHPPLSISIYSPICTSLSTLCGCQIHLQKLCPLGRFPLCLSFRATRE